MARVLNGGGPDDEQLMASVAAIEPVPFVDHAVVEVE